MKKTLAKIMMYLIYLVGALAFIKWGLYDTFADCDFEIFSCLALPFKLIIKGLVIYVSVIGLLALNSYLFTNTFKN